MSARTTLRQKAAWVDLRELFVCLFGRVVRVARTEAPVNFVA